MSLGHGRRGGGCITNTVGLFVHLTVVTSAALSRYQVTVETHLYGVKVPALSSRMCLIKTLCIAGCP